VSYVYFNFPIYLRLVSDPSHCSFW